MISKFDDAIPIGNSEVSNYILIYFSTGSLLILDKLRDNSKAIFYKLNGIRNDELLYLNA